jgi:hypothetical protein
MGGVTRELLGDLPRLRFPDRFDQQVNVRMNMKMIFPYASHQVLLLSTDEEIRGESYEKIARWIGHSYRLDFDQTDKRPRSKPATWRGVEHGYRTHPAVPVLRLIFSS